MDQSIPIQQTQIQQVGSAITDGFNRSIEMANAASVQIPVFDVANIREWFRIAESQFRIKGIKNSTTKAELIISKFPSEVFQKIMPWIDEQADPDNISYNDLKSEVLRIFTWKEPQRAQRALQMIQDGLGDNDPESIYQELLILRKLPDGKEVDLWKEIFLQIMPKDIREKIENTDQLNLSNIVERCQKFWISHISTRNNRNTANIVASSTCNSPSTDFNQIEMVDSVTSRRSNVSFQARKGPSSFPRNEIQRNPPLPPKHCFNEKGHCYYHDKFGNRARRCMDGCSWRVPKNGSTGLGNN